KMYPELRSGNFVLVTMTDTGSCMTEEVKKHAIEPFFTTKDVCSCTGLGLSMVYGFVKQTGGHLQLYSEVGRGTTVRIYLPAI
ncbi:ATP-binding protein, partial [Rhizobium ruizarguesonis]